MSDCEPPSAKRIKKCKATSYKASSREFARYRRNRYRKERRKRSTTRYYAQLKRRRSSRASEELCEALSEFDVTDMSAATSVDPLKDVAEWHRREQLAYWKSRALSLELENRMLHECLRNSYAKQVWDYENYVKNRGKGEGAPGGEKKEREANGEGKNEDDKLPPREGVGEGRRREMKRLYGGMAPKITGMETAVQLNYELQVDQHKPPYWPNIPLNL